MRVQKTKQPVKAKYELNPNGKSEKNLATAVLYMAVCDYLNSRKTVRHFGSANKAVAAWASLTKQQKKKGAWFGDFKLTPHKMIRLGYYSSAKEFLYPTKENSALTELWTNLAEIPIGYIRRGLR